MAALRNTIVVENNGNVVLAAPGVVLVGGRTGCDLVLDDPIVADRHCRITHEGGFLVRDLDSVTGTWVDGVQANPTAQIRDGSEIVLGTCRLTARIEDREGISTLVLDLQRQAFWWKKPGKGVFDNDPDAMVRTEVGFSRFLLLEVSNRLAIVAALVLLIAAAFLATVMEPLADPGPLLPPHAIVADIAAGKPDPHGGFAEFGRLRAEQGCDVCHSTGAGTPATKCLQCHADLAAPATWRHPYVNGKVDGKLGAVPGMQDAESSCTVCHTDHEGKGFLKPASDRLAGKCEICHSDGSTPFDRATLLEKAPVTQPPPRMRPFATYRFPHDVHLTKEIGCAVCHTIHSEVKARHDAGAGSDPARNDFAETPFEVCASCHVPGAAATNMTVAEQEKWRSKEAKHSWEVRWHGTDDAKCQQCHAAVERGSGKVFGPELRTVERPNFTPEQHAAERALYVAEQRLHEDQFEQHSGGQACTQCHLRGRLSDHGAPPARAFWHGLHVAEETLAPPLGKGSEVSKAGDGCISCHADLKDAKALHTAAEGGYRWPAQAEAQAACKQCHREGERTGGKQLVLRAAGGEIPPTRRAAAPDFPHGAHVGSTSFGVKDTALAEGCFACHEFTTPTGGSAFQSIPRTKAKARDCTQCHTGHENIAGNHCQTCHRPETGQSNSFLLSAKVPVGSMVGGRTVPPPAQRSWPALNPFSHISRGHVDVACSKCHDKTGIEKAKTLDVVGIPDDATPACRECHIERQFHWR